MSQRKKSSSQGEGLVSNRPSATLAVESDYGWNSMKQTHIETQNRPLWHGSSGIQGLKFPDKKNIEMFLSLHLYHPALTETVHF